MTPDDKVDDCTVLVVHLRATKNGGGVMVHDNWLVPRVEAGAKQESPRELTPSSGGYRTPKSTSSERGKTLSPMNPSVINI